LRNQVVYRRLPELEARIQDLEARLAALEGPSPSGENSTDA
jgi:BMFP domain-containing protein YqiC